MWLADDTCATSIDFDSIQITRDCRPDGTWDTHVTTHKLPSLPSSNAVFEEASDYINQLTHKLAQEELRSSAALYTRAQVKKPLPDTTSGCLLRHVHSHVLRETNPRHPTSSCCSGNCHAAPIVKVSQRNDGNRATARNGSRSPPRAKGSEQSRTDASPPSSYTEVHQWERSETIEYEPGTSTHSVTVRRSGPSEAVDSVDSLQPPVKSVDPEPPKPLGKPPVTITYRHPSTGDVFASSGPIQASTISPMVPIGRDDRLTVSPLVAAGPGRELVTRPIPTHRRSSSVALHRRTSSAQPLNTSYVVRPSADPPMRTSLTTTTTPTVTYTSQPYVTYSPPTYVHYAPATTSYTPTYMQTTSYTPTTTYTSNYATSTFTPSTTCPPTTTTTYTTPITTTYTPTYPPINQTFTPTSTPASTTYTAAPPTYTTADPTYHPAVPEASAPRAPSSSRLISPWTTPPVAPYGQRRNPSCASSTTTMVPPRTSPIMTRQPQEQANEFTRLPPSSTLDNEETLDETQSGPMVKKFTVAIRSERKVKNFW